MEEQELLNKLGLTNSESKIYLILVEKGQATIVELIKKTQIHTSVLYSALQRLIHKGLVTYIKKGRTKTFIATNPKVLLQYASDLQDELTNIIPKWEKQLTTKTSESIAEIYEGLPGLTNLFNMLFSEAKPGDLYLSFTLSEEFKNENYLKWFNNLGIRRIALKLNVKALCPKKFKTLFKKLGNPEILSRTKLRFSNFEFPQGIVIFHDSIVFLSFDKNVKAIRINDSKFSKQYRNFFLQIYASGEPYLSQKQRE